MELSPELRRRLNEALGWDANKVRLIEPIVVKAIREAALGGYEDAPVFVRVPRRSTRRLCPFCRCDHGLDEEVEAD